MRRRAYLIATCIAALLPAACDEAPPQAAGGSGGETGAPTSGGGGAGHSGGGDGGAGGAGAGGAGGAVHPPPMCSSSVETDDYAAGLTKVGESGYSVVLVESAPAPPGKGDNTWTVQVVDPGGQAQSGLTIDVYPFMPDHGHGTAVKAAVTPAGEAGTYVIAPVNLFMSGVWVVRLKLIDEASSAELDSVKLSFCIGP